jgi:hypothetical protein
MILLIVVIWSLLLFTIPPALLATAGNCKVYPLKTSTTVTRLLLALLAYLLISFFTFCGLLLFLLGPEPRLNQAIPFLNKIICLIMVSGYAAAGWFLCSFVIGKPVKPSSIFRFKAEKPQSIFEAE